MTSSGAAEQLARLVTTTVGTGGQPLTVRGVGHGQDHPTTVLTTSPAPEVPKMIGMNFSWS